MATYLLVNSVTYDDGSTLSKDHDGVPTLPGLGSYAPFTAPVSQNPFHVVGTIRYYNGSTVGLDQDGIPVANEDTLPLVFNNLSLTLVQGRYLVVTPLFDNGVTIGKDQDGTLTVPVDGSTPFFTSPSVRGVLTLVRTPTYYDGVTESKDQDGELHVTDDLVGGPATSPARHVTDMSASISGEASATSDSSADIRSASGALTGEGQVSATANIKYPASASISGEATTSASFSILFTASASISGSATVSADCARIALVQGSSDLVLTAIGTLSEVVTAARLPGISRTFFSGEGVAPQDTGVVGQTGNAAVNNKIKANSSSSFALVASYSGVAYVLGGPADPTSSPVRLGFKQGDRLKLKGPTGTEPNHGRELTLHNPSGFAVLEELTMPDTTEYEFTVFRRVS